MTTARRNRFEVALWIFGGGLIVIAVAGFVALTIVNSDPNRLTSDCDSDGNCGFGLLQAVLQSLYLFAPAAMTAGLAAMALALTVRALDVNARHRVPEPGETQSVAEPVAELTADPTGARTADSTVPDERHATSVSSYLRPRRELTVDKSIFMRPRD